MNNNINTKEYLKNESLKLQDPEIPPDNPWKEDALKRKEMATALTNLISNESYPLVISLNGNWGTGKTFLLKRWQVELEKNDFKSIYFNAWEDDFCDEPLIAIIGQLADFLKENKFSYIGNRIIKIAGSLVKQNIPNIVYQGTGIKIELESLSDQSLTKYKKQRETKEELKKTLKVMSTKLVKKTNSPLIFIIDELDRCRPTFAVELLERVKHIFDIPNVVFVFGINRNELCKSIESIYGKIDAAVYLRRFFNLEFTLPSIENKDFCDHLIKKYKLTHLNVKFEEEISIFCQVFPIFCNYFDLSLRDIDSCIVSILFIERNFKERDGIYPVLVSAMLILRLKNKDLYQEFIQGKCLGSKVLNYIDSFMPHEYEENDLSHYRDVLEAEIYVVTNNRTDLNEKMSIPYKELNRLQRGDELNNPEFLSERIKKYGNDRIIKIQTLMCRTPGSSFINRRIPIQKISSLLELAETVIQK